MKKFWFTIRVFCCMICLLFGSSSVYATSFRVGGVTLNKKVKSWQEFKQQGIIRQSLDFSCGAAGISTLLHNYLNDPTTEEEIINDLLKHVDLAKVKARKGFSLLDLKRYLEAKGYKATGYQMDFDFLVELNQPVLVPIKFKNYRHFVIVKGVVGDRVFIADPAVGNMTMKDVKFVDIWLKGIGLVVEREGVDDSDRDYALAITEEDALFADYKNINRFLTKDVLRNTIPTTFEWSY